MFEASALIDDMVVIVPPGEERYSRAIVERYGISKARRIVAGGRNRQASVAAGLAVVARQSSMVVIHDAARPFVTPDLIERVLAAAAASGAAVAAIPVVDTIKRQLADRQGAETVDRAGLWAAQTPQAFHTALLIEAFRRAEADHYVATDDAGLVERLGHPVTLVEGHTSNVKITTPHDFELAEAAASAHVGAKPREAGGS